MSRSDDARTLKLELIEFHYERMGGELHWTSDRYRRLAAALQFTVHELAAFIRIKPRAIETMLRDGKFPPTVELHLSLIERTVFPTSKPPIFPNVDRPGDSEAVRHDEAAHP